MLMLPRYIRGGNKRRMIDKAQKTLGMLDVIKKVIREMKRNAEDRKDVENSCHKPTKY